MSNFHGTTYYVAFYALNYRGVRQRFEFKVENQNSANRLAVKFQSPYYYFGVKGIIENKYKTIF